MSRGFDIASSGKLRQNQIAPSTAKPPAKSAGSFKYLRYILCLLLISNTKEKLTEKERANMEIILDS